MSQRSLSHHEGGPEPRNSSSRGRQIAIALIAVLAITASVGSLLLPSINRKLAESRISQYESRLKDKFDATQKQLEIIRGMSDVTTAQAAVPSLRETLETEITANDELAKFLNQNPLTDNEVLSIRPRMIEQLRSLNVSRNAIITARVAMADDLDRSIRQELSVLKSEIVRRNQSVTACNATISTYLHAKAPQTSVAFVDLPTDPRQPMATLTDAIGDPPEIPFIELPPWEPPSDQVFQKMGPEPAHVRLIGVPNDSIRGLSNVLLKSAEGAKVMMAASSASAYFVSVSSVPDLEDYVRKIASMGQVLELRPDQRMITLWVSPATLRELQTQGSNLRGGRSQ